MAKKAVPIDQQKLETIIKKLEEDSAFSTQSELFRVAAGEYTKQYGFKITPSLVYLRVRQWNIQLKTSKSKAEPWKHVKSLPVEEDIEPVIEKAQTLDEILANATPKEKLKYKKLAKRALKGSRIAAIKLHCLDCAAFDRKEVAHCLVKSCPLWLFRPYQSTIEEEEVESE